MGAGPLKGTTSVLAAAWLVCMLGATLPASAQPYAYVVVTEYRDDSAPAQQRLLVIDTRTRARVGNIPLEMGCLGCAVPRTLVAAPDGSRLFAINRASGTLSVVDALTRTVIRSLSIGPAGTNAAALAMSPDGTRLYVLRASNILVIDPRSLAPLATMQTATSTNSFDIQVSPDGRRLYVLEALGRVVILESATGTVVGAVPVPAGTISSMGLSRDGSTLYVTGNPGFGNPANVAVYNAVSGQSITSFTAPGWRVGVTPDDTQVWLAGDSSLALVNRATNAIVGTFPWMFGAQVMDFTPDSAFAFVSVVSGVAVVETANGRRGVTIPIDFRTEGLTGSIVIAPAPPPPPEPPTNLTVRSIDGFTVTMQWQPPASGPAPASYRLEGGINPGETLAAMPTGSAAPVFTFTAPPGSFYVRMRSVNGSLESAPSDEVRLVTVPAGAPSPPDSLRALVNGSSLWLTWRNTFAGGRPQALVLDVTGAAATSIPLGLTEGFAYSPVPAGTYTLRLRATNAAGTSAASNPVTVSFPEPCPGAPAAPTGFIAYRLGSTLSLLWDPSPVGSATTGYVVTVTGAFSGSFAVAGRTIGGTVGSGTYHLTVAGTNACGQGPATPAQTLVVP